MADPTWDETKPADEPEPAAAPAWDDTKPVDTTPSENPHDLIPFLKAQGSGLVDLAKKAGLGAAHAIAHPIDTAKDVGDWMLAGNGPAGDPDNALINGRAIRNIPVVGNAIDDTVASGKALAADAGALIKGGTTKPVGQQAFDAYKKGEASADAQHAEEHPLTDFIQKNAGLAMLPQGIVKQAGAMALDAFNKSIAQGNDPLTAVQDARNTALLVGATIKAGKTLKAVPGAVGRGIAKELGVSADAIDRYRAAPDAVNDAAQYAQDPEALKNLVDEKVAPINQAVADAQGAVDQAAESGKGAVAQAASEAENAGQAVDDTRQPPISMASEIPAHLDQTGEKLAGMSSDSFDILDQEGHTFRTEDMEAAIENQMRGLRIGGVEPSVGPDAAAYKALGQFKQMVARIGKNAMDTTGDTEVPASVVKRLIQTLDATSKAAYGLNAGELGPEAASNLAQVRGAFNRALRDASPLPDTPTPMDQPPASYAEAMDRLAPQVQLTSEMSKVFGNEQSALTALKAAADPMTPRGYIVRQLLQRYDAANGTNFAQRVADFYDKPRAALEKAQARVDATKQRAQTGVDAAKQALAEKQVAAAQVSKIGPNSTENALKSVQAGRNIEARKQLEALDPNLAQTVQDAGVAKQFQRPTTNGSRRTVFGGAVGGAVGHVVGHLVGSEDIGRWVGSAVGAGVGFLADKYGGQAVKFALDAGIKVDKLIGTPYLKTIMEAAQRGEQPLAVAHYILSQQDHGYQDLMRGVAGEDQKDDEQKPSPNIKPVRGMPAE